MPRPFLLDSEVKDSQGNKEQSWEQKTVDLSSERLVFKTMILHFHQRQSIALTTKQFYLCSKKFILSNSGSKQIHVCYQKESIWNGPDVLVTIACPTEFVLNRNDTLLSYLPTQLDSENLTTAYIMPQPQNISSEPCK